MNDQTGLDNEMCTLKSLFTFEFLFEFHLNPSLSFADTSIPAFYDLFSYLTNFLSNIGFVYIIDLRLWLNAYVSCISFNFDRRPDFRTFI